MSFVFAMMVQAANVAWSPPIQAEWVGEGAGIEAQIVTTDAPISMQGVTALTVVLSSDKPGFRVSPFIAATRGIAFEVVDQSGRIVAPSEPIAISPPAPPVERGKLTEVTADAPLKVTIAERAVNLFPKPGRYRLRAIINLMSTAEQPASYKKLRTDYITVEVSA